MRAASRAPKAPAVNPMIPCGAIASPVISGESLSTCWKYSDSTSISPPFHNPSSKFSKPAVRKAGRRSRAAGSSGSGWRRSAAKNASPLAANMDRASRLTGESHPVTSPRDTAKTSAVTEIVMSAAPRASSLRTAPRSREPASSRGATAAARMPTGTLTRNTARQLVN
jgi:hypothetical protein